MACYITCKNNFLDIFIRVVFSKVLSRPKKTSTWNLNIIGDLINYKFHLNGRSTPACDPNPRKKFWQWKIFSHFSSFSIRRRKAGTELGLFLVVIILVWILVGRFGIFTFSTFIFERVIIFIKNHSLHLFICKSVNVDVNAPTLLLLLQLKIKILKNLGKPTMQEIL